MARLSRRLKRKLSNFGRTRKIRNSKYGSRKINRSKHGSKKSKFGKISNLSRIMGNNTWSNDMSQFQIYTGMSPSQMQDHLNGIPTNLRDTFYANTL